MLKLATEQDFKEFWPVFQSIVAAQETYAFDPEMRFEDGYSLWCVSPIKTFVFEGEDGSILGSYYIKANAMGPSNHICNCGYMVSENARGQGLARKMCEHSQNIALELGFEAMQFNSVVSTNEVAVKLWQKMGFEIIGTIPKAYRHKRLGYVDSYVMHKPLAR
ncbi:GNAT family N-acetyltransferase [Marinomonas mediterranea]|uniref:GNAT family N-acetyltransferase n=1 Tax=Marinomonas mediterranea TaxID=119864 RepID=UPI0023494E46|nr:GNAT family N-acetyltransferase [Marinomonas mediterranea]WCN09012.1 GNAT family N-acetyltransferase [Marinomonas mediterranea]WCN13046.1 GNAT family N-acetyltransferase [Marinomonas mediterranea]